MGRNQRLRVLYIAFGAFILMNYQNCAPAPNLAAAPSESEVRIVDDWNHSKINIFESFVQLESADAEYTVEGLCERKMTGSLIWHLTTEGSLVENGEINCLGGGFAILLSGLQSLQCGELYQLSVQTAEGDNDSAVFTRRCPL